MSDEMPDGHMRGTEESFQLKEEDPNIFESSAQGIVPLLPCALVDLTENLT